MSDKFKFATKVALSLTLAFLIPLALGWPQASTAATTVMLIASTGSRRESLAKGTLRILGTLVGAVIGLLLVGLFAQDRLLYMLTVSIVISFVFYIRNAYKQDPTLFMLTGVMILMMSNGGDAGGAFIYGVDRAYMTMFGVVVYTLVGIFVFPTKTEQNLRMLAAELGALQLKLFKRLSNQVSTMPQSEIHESHNQSDEDIEAANEVTGTTESAGNIETEPTEEGLVQQLYAAQNALEQRYSAISAECSDVSAYKKEWDLALYYYKKVTQLLIFVAQSKDLASIDIPSFITNYHDTIYKIEDLFASVEAGWGEKNSERNALEHKVSYDVEALNSCSHLQKGSLITLGYILNSLHETLSRLTATVYCIDSVTGRVSFKETVPKTPGRFLWWDAENAKTAIKVFVTYWVAGILWIYFNPPGGYSFVIFSTIFVSVLSYIPVHPVLLLVLFTFGFLFAVPSYVFILPQLSLGVELGAFIFIYTFIGFYLFKGPITIFFLIGLFILGIDNTMTYHFGIILTIILLFYLVVLMIIVSYYFPFSSRPEHLFLVMRERFFRHVCGLLRVQQLSDPSAVNRLHRSLHLVTMNVTVKKLILWSGKVNQKTITQASPEALVEFAKGCNLLCNHLNTFVSADQMLKTNVLVNQARATYVSVTKGDQVLAQMAKSLTGGRRQEALNDVFHAYSIDYESTEEKLESFFNSLSLNDYSDSEIAGFYILLNLNKNVYQAMNQCKVAYEDVNWVNLRQMKF
ncbi:FUSC family protein [Photobacterium sagamiensis]|uniref:FUSC family protein n=1 Tax=Photobacterium sagamiensis TaxID=2910241 RepID=UPI003D0C97BB